LITHHDGCFGCGQANLFGLQLELDGDGERVRGRFFVKQDHQGPPGYAHGGIVAAALDEAMALALHADGLDARTRRIELDLLAPAPVGAFVEVEAAVDRRDGRRIHTRAVAREGDTVVAEAVADFVVS
jgi:acyl-coenzyme A thioesterase PaaI-like protein